MTQWFTSTSTIATSLAARPLDLLELRLLLMHVTGLTRMQLITQDQRQLTETEAQQLNQLVAARLAGQPIAYLLGYREFFGLNFITTPAVLIPRADTELLVELALEKAPAAASVLDLGTGSGAIALALTHSRADLRVTALDLSAEALAVAQRNAEQLVPDALASGRCQLIQSDWFSALKPQGFDLIVSNPPYIEAGDAHLQQGDLRFEPAQALSDGADGLSHYRQIIQQAPAWLKPHGQLYFEHGYDQAEAVRALLSAAGFSEVQSWRDLAGIERVSGGRWCAQN